MNEPRGGGYGSQRGLSGKCGVVDDYPSLGELPPALARPVHETKKKEKMSRGSLQACEILNPLSSSYSFIQPQPLVLFLSEAFFPSITDSRIQHFFHWKSILTTILYVLLFFFPLPHSHRVSDNGNSFFFLGDNRFERLFQKKHKNK